jgi:sirohydrochlorin ferrochelatase
MRAVHDRLVGAGASVLLMGHGSPDPAAHAELRELRALVESRLEVAVRLGVLEHPAAELPALDVAVDALAPCTLVAAQPLILFEGLHGRHDMPEVAAGARARLGVEVRLGSPFGQDPALLALAMARVAEARPGPGDVLLFVGRGSSEPRARAQTADVAAAVAGEFGLPCDICYTGISRPLLAEGIELALRRRPRRVLALPYLLHTGVLVRRVAEVLGPAAAEAGVELATLAHLGNAPEVVDMVAGRVEALLDGRP